MQLVAQVITALAGLLIVRSLSKPEYAAFTIASTVQNMLIQLSETGLGIGLISLSGSIRDDPSRLGRLTGAALAIRKQTTVVWTILLSPLLYGMLRRSEVPVWPAWCLTATIILSVGVQMNVGIYRAVLQVCGKLRHLQEMELVFAGSRLVLIAAAAFVFLNAELALIVTILSTLFQWVVARRHARSNFRLDGPLDPADRRMLTTRVRQLLPDAIFYCLQGQVWLFLTALTGKTGQVADLGALGRLSVLFAVLGSVMGNVLAPAFSRPLPPPVLFKRYCQIIMAYGGLGAALFAGVYTFPNAFLWLLGSNYMHLQPELALLTFSAVLSSVAQAMWALNAVRGWTDYLWTEIPLRLSLQIVLLWWLDVSTSVGILQFMIYATLSPLLVSGVLAWRGFRQLNKSAALPT